MRKTYFLPAFTALLILSACHVTQRYKRPDVMAANLYRDSSATDTNSMAAMPWRSLFSDTVLQNLIQEGIQHNLNLKNAVLKIAEANATLQESKAAYLPILSAGASVTRSKASQAAQTFPAGLGFDLSSTTYQAQLSAGWTVNVWGQLSSLKREAIAAFLQSDAAKRAVQTALIAGIANNYYQLLAYDQQLAITRQTVKNDSDDVETNKTLLKAAVVTGAAVVQSEANRYAAEVSIPDLELEIRQTENALCILLGRGPGPIKRLTLADQVPVDQLNAGLSTQLLKNRPDVQQAEFAFMAAFENTNVAHSYFYPTLSITAEGGISSLQLKDLFNNSVFYNLIGGLTQPILNQGQNKARYRIAKAQQLEAFNTYQQTILGAGQAVANDLYSYKQAVRKAGLRKNQLAALEKSVDYTKQLLTYSAATNYTDVLTSEQNLLAAQLAGVNDRLQQLQSIVSLYTDLGGGWQ